MISQWTERGHVQAVHLTMLSIQCCQPDPLAVYTWRPLKCAAKRGQLVSLGMSGATLNGFQLSFYNTLPTQCRLSQKVLE